MKLMLKHLKRYIPFALLASLFMVAEVYVDLFQPRMMEVIVDDGILGIHNGGRSDIDLIIHTGVIMILVVAAGGICGMLSGVFSNVAGQNYGNDLRKACFRNIMGFSFEQMDKFTTGSLITRITNDVSQVQQLVMQLIRGLVRCLMFFIGGTIALLSLDISFGVIVACAFPLIIIDIIFIVWKTNPLFLLLQKCLDGVNSIMQENVSGVRVVKAFVQEDREKQRFSDANQKLVDTQFDVQMLLSFLRPVMNIVLNLAVVGVIYVGAVQVSEGDIAPGTVMAAITYVSQILNGMVMLAMIFQSLSRGMVSGKRISQVLNTEAAIKDGAEDGAGAEGATDAAAENTPAVKFRNVVFRYPGRKRRVLRRIDLEVRKGECVAIIGSTGSGKTSLISLIPRFYEPVEGSVEVMGLDVKKYNLRALRDKVSVCLQKSELFSTTIRDNIAIGEPGATQEEIERAAKAAQAHQFILEQPQGYDTPVAERGMSLSGGQRQRIAIARALLKKSDILIFDDSTSALDLRTEAALYEALDKNYKDLTKIIIAQRIASVLYADRIAVMDKGKIVAIGTHEELMATSPVYLAIYKSQHKDDEEVSA